MMTVPEPDGEIEVASRPADELVFPNLHDEQQELNQHPVARTSYDRLSGAEQHPGCLQRSFRLSAEFDVVP